MRHLTRAEAGSPDWPALVAALRDGHRRPRADVRDTFLQRDDVTLLSRAAAIDGLGMGVKSVTVMPNNAAHGWPTVQGAMLVFDRVTGAPEAVVDGDLVTAWKTAADSVLGATLLASAEPDALLIVGAGEVAANLARAYAAVFPRIGEIRVWNRTPPRAEALVATLRNEGINARAVRDLAWEAGRADIITCATMARDPILRGDWIGPGTHVDLVGAFRTDMREADDALMRRAELFVDSRDTTLEHIGELAIPIAAGVIGPDDVRGDLYDLVAGRSGRSDGDAITVFKNGGGAHLDLIVARAILDR